MAGAHPESVGIDVIEAHGSGLAAIGREHDLTVSVPTCGDWRLADLVWHLAEVHGFWHHVVANRPADPDGYEPPERPPDAELPDVLDDRCRALTAALADADPAEPAWSWADEQTVGFTLRRQSHEALIHHLDGVLAADGSLPTVDPALAADGIDELVTVMLSGVPEWATYEPGDGTVLLGAADTGDEWTLGYGRMIGTSPATGTTYDIVAMELLDHVDDPTNTVAGPAFELDRWLWGRGGEIDVTGDPAGADRLRATVADCTG